MIILWPLVEYSNVPCACVVGLVAYLVNCCFTSLFGINGHLSDIVGPIR